MARYTDDSKERVRDAIDMIDLVGTRAELRRAGADSYTGLCPFHDERTPSFSVTPSKKMYYCFGCQAAGDPFTFAMETQGLDFPGALEWLADRYDVKLELAEQDPRALARRAHEERLQALLERTCGYYERYLWESEEAVRARDYLAGRGLEEALLRRFRVGYAPSAYDRVLLASRRGGFSEQELLQAGLVQRSSDQPGRVYDRFRARITFPLCDGRGRVVGFGARAMRAEDPAKYLNSSESDIFHKREHLFGEHLARRPAARAGAVVLCEGYTDVIAMHQAGVENCVGSMGTALSAEQVGVLARLAPRLILALDADGAGQAAMLKSAALAAAKRVELRVVPLPPGSDPADVLQREGAAALPALVDRAVAFVRFRVERILAAGELGTPEGRDRVLEELRPVFAEIGPGAMREELEREVAARLGVSERTIERVLGQGAARPAGATAPPGAALAAGAPLTRAALDAGERTEYAFLELCIALPERGSALLGEIDIDATFANPLTRTAAERLRASIESPAVDEQESALRALLTKLAVIASTLDAMPGQLEVAVRQLELARIERLIESLRAGGGAGVEQLGHERAEIKAELDEWMARALGETAAPAR
jgi:DNA primase